MLGEVGVEGVVPPVGAERGIERRQGVDVFAGGELHPAEQLIAHQDAERAHIARETLRRGRHDRLLDVLGGLESIQIDDAVVGAGPQLLPLIQERGVDLADELSEPLDEVTQILVLQILRDGLRRRAIRVRQVPQHHSL